jgi:hypothetical protein
VTDTTTATGPVNPLTEDAVKLTIDRHGQQVECPARIVAPGLAIALDPESKTHRPRYLLVHTPSSLHLGFTRCGHHVQEVAQIAVEMGIDWTADKAAVIEGLKVDGRINLLRTGTWCRSHCDGDGPEPKSWGMRCTTCDYQWEDEYDEGPLDAKQAKRTAGDHECEPEVQIFDPTTNKWLHPDRVDDDGTVRDLNKEFTSR